MAAIYALAVASLENMNHIADSAMKAGGAEPKLLQDHRFMQLRTVRILTDLPGKYSLWT